MSLQFDSLADFVPPTHDCELSVVAVNRTESGPEPKLDSVFGEFPVEVSSLELAEFENDRLLLLRDDEVVSESDVVEFGQIVEAAADTRNGGFSAGAVSLDPPEMLTYLTDASFRVRVDPRKRDILLFTAISRVIEHNAWTDGQGRLRVGLQRLSRLDDERGTRQVYDKLADTDVDVHAYGRPNWVPPKSIDVVSHGAYGQEFSDTWFVIYRGGEESQEASFIGRKTGPNEWRAHWTFDTDRVRTIERFVERTM